MSDMKCPVCGDEMKLTSLYMDGNHRYSHKYIGALSGGKDRCPFDGETLPRLALQEIHRTRKALDVAVDALKRIKFRGEHSKYECCKVSGNIAKQALEQITALEQKE